MAGPLVPYTNPWGQAGRAVGALGGDVMSFANEQERTRAAVEDMVARRRDKIVADQRAAEMLEMSRAAAARQQDAAARQARDDEALQARQKREQGVRTEIGQLLRQGKLTRELEQNLYALADLEPPARFFSPEPPKPEGPVNWHTVDREDGLYGVNPRTLETKRVSGVPGKGPAANAKTPESLASARAVWEGALQNLGPMPAENEYDERQDWFNRKRIIEGKILELQANEAALMGRGGRTPPPEGGGNEIEVARDYIRRGKSAVAVYDRYLQRTGQRHPDDTRK